VSIWESLIFSVFNFRHKFWKKKKELIMNIYVGNLSRQATGDDLREAFEGYGQVDKAHVVKDKFTGESRGFGFVEMPSGDEAKTAIEGMNGKAFMGRTLNVSEARPRTDRNDGGNRRPGGGGGGGGRGRGGKGFGGGRGGEGGGGRRY
jgi:RNA recognition motif-containing protein